MTKHISELDLSVRSLNILSRNGVKTVEDIDLNKLVQNPPRNFGKKCMVEVVEGLWGHYREEQAQKMNQIQENLLEYRRMMGNDGNYTDYLLLVGYLLKNYDPNKSVDQYDVQRLVAQWHICKED